MSTYVPIQAITPSSNVSSVEFAGIPQIYTDLMIVCEARSNTNSNEFAIRFNSDSGTNYSSTIMYGNGTNALSTRNSNTTNLGFGGSGTSYPFIIQVLSYSNSTTNKTVLSRSTGNISSVFSVRANVGLWRNTSAINSISLLFADGSSIVSGSTFTLYGIGSGSPKAFGGNTVLQSGGYWYHVYRSSGIFETTQSISNLDYFVVGGGGGGGNYWGGGGGAGGFRSLSSQTLNGTFTVTVGAGGSRAVNQGTNGVNGSNSSFSSTTSAGGGGGGGGIGGSGYSANGNAGGSGGGGSGNYFGAGGGGAGNTPSVSPSQGNNGAGATGVYQGGGGGGAGAAGSGTSGGAGTNSFATWATATSTGVSGFYAGGGQAGLTSGSQSSSSGGGGLGSVESPNTAGTSGTANTGSGGGGNRTGSLNHAGDGGSGIVIVRYPV